MVKNLTILIFIGKQIKVTNKQHQKVSNKRQEWWVSHDFLLRVTQLLRKSDPKREYSAQYYYVDAHSKELIQTQHRDFGQQVSISHLSFS